MPKISNFAVNRNHTVLHVNLMEGFMVDLKTFLGLAIHLPRCHKVNIRMIFQGKKPQTFMIPIYSTTVLYDLYLFIFFGTDIVSEGCMLSTRLTIVTRLMANFVLQLFSALYQANGHVYPVIYLYSL